MEFFKRIRKKKEYFIKVILSKQLSLLIKIIARTHINKRIEIRHTELLHLFDDYSKTLNYVKGIFVNGAVTIVMFYLKRYKAIYYTLTKYLYSYKTGNMLMSFNNNSSRIMLEDIFNNKKWDELLKPNVYRAIIQIYQNSSY